MDMADLIDATWRARLAELARAARAEQGGSGVQIEFLTIKALGDEPIEDFSIRVAEAWKIGTKGLDNGLLFVVSADHHTRLEVGGGLEGDLTDAQSKRILEEILKPAFRAGDFGGGLYAGARAALAAVHGLPAGVAAGTSAGLRGQAGSPGLGGGATHAIGFAALLLFLFHGGGSVFLFLLLFLGIALLRLLSGGGGYFSGGGGGGWSGSGGGGWSGGGGGFSGGGASGGW